MYATYAMRGHLLGKDTNHTNPIISQCSNVHYFTMQQCMHAQIHFHASGAHSHTFCLAR